jgi:hypothetical protein
VTAPTSAVEHASSSACSRARSQRSDLAGRCEAEAVAPATNVGGCLGTRAAADEADHEAMLTEVASAVATTRAALVPVGARTAVGVVPFDKGREPLRPLRILRAPRARSAHERFVTPCLTGAQRACGSAAVEAAAELPEPW